MTIKCFSLRISDWCYKFSYNTHTKKSYINSLKFSDWQKGRNYDTGAKRKVQADE